MPPISLKNIAKEAGYDDPDALIALSALVSTLYQAAQQNQNVRIENHGLILLTSNDTPDSLQRPVINLPPLNISRWAIDQLAEYVQQKITGDQRRAAHRRTATDHSL